MGAWEPAEPSGGAAADGGAAGVGGGVGGVWEAISRLRFLSTRLGRYQPQRSVFFQMWPEHLKQLKRKLPRVISDN